MRFVDVLGVNISNNSVMVFHGANKYLEHSAKNIPGLTQRYSYNFGVFILVNSYI